MESDKQPELFVNTQLNYVHFDETPDLYKHAEKNRIYFYSSSDEVKCENILDCAETTLTEGNNNKELLIETGPASLPISQLCKSSSSESDACSSTRLLDNHMDNSVIGIKTNDLEMTYKLENKLITPSHHRHHHHQTHHNHFSSMLEMASKYQVSDISYTDLKPMPPSDPETESMWGRLQSSMSTNMRLRYLDSTGPTSNSPQRFQCCSKSRYSIVLVTTIVLGALVTIFFGLASFTSLIPWPGLGSQTNGLHGTLHGPGGATSEAKWWKDAFVYEIFVPSFKDHDADGFGDIRGLIEKLPYLRDLGVTVIRLNSIYSALDYPYQYENVINFTRLDPHLGDLSDLDHLIVDLHSHGMKLILDINLSLTSDQHPWAANWLLNRTGPYKYFYVNDTSSVTMKTPGSTVLKHAKDQNWIGLTEIHHAFGGHFHLNWSNPSVQSTMIQCLEFWLHRGIDGFYLKNLDSYSFDQGSFHTILTFLETLRLSLSQFQDERILVADKSDLDDISERIRSERADSLLSNCDKCNYDLIGSDHLSSLPSSSSYNHHHHHSHQSIPDKDVYAYFDLVNIFLTIKLNSTEVIHDQVNGYFLNAPKSRPWVLWSIGTATRSRLATRIGKEYTLVSTFLLVMLPGSINFFYGDEIGLQDSIDPVSGKEYRGGQLCPVPWTSELNGNFSGPNLSHPWLPINMNYLINNVQRESETINRLQQLITFRKYNLQITVNDKPVNYLFHYVNGGFLALERYFSRRLSSSSIVRYRYVLFANIGTTQRIKDFTDKFHFGTIRVTSNPKRLRDFLYLRSLKLDPGEALIAEME